MSKEILIKFILESSSKSVAASERDVKKLGSSLTETAKKAQPLDDVFAKAGKWGVGILGLTAAIGGLSAGFRKALDAAEGWKRVEGKINLVSASTMELLAAQQSLFSISQETFALYENSATLFSRMRSATKDLNLEQQKLLDVTQIVNQGLVISSSSVSEQNSVITQLSQALASGVLRGEEFNSIMENGNRIAVAMADGLGVTIGKLREMAMAGELTTTKVIDALISQKEVMSGEFARMPVLVDQAFTLIDNSTTKLVGSIDAATGASRSLSGAIVDVSAAIDGLSVSVNSVEGAANIDFMMATLSRTVDGFLLLGAVAKNTAEIGVSGIAELTYGTLAPIMKMMRIATEGLNSIGLASNATLEEHLRLEIWAYDAAAKAQQDVKASYKDIEDAATSFNETIEERIAAYRKEREESKATVNTVTASAKAATGASSAVLTLDAATKNLVAQFDAATGIIEKMPKSLDEVNAEYSAMYTVVKDIFDTAQMEKFFKSWQEQAEKAAPKMRSMFSDIGLPEETTFDDGFFGPSEKEIEKMRDAFEGLSDVSKSWTAGLEGNAKALANMSNAFADISKEQKAYQALVDAGINTKKEDEQHLQNQVAGYANLAGAMSGVFAEGSAAAKAFSGIQSGLALVNAVTAVTGAWASAPFPANLPAVAATTSAVVALLSNIGQTFGGGGGGGSKGGPSGTTAREYEAAEKYTEQITDRLDRQITILEKIAMDGTAMFAGIEKAKTAVDIQTQPTLNMAGGWMQSDFEKWVKYTLPALVTAGYTPSITSGTNEEFNRDFVQMLQGGGGYTMMRDFAENAPAKAFDRGEKGREEFLKYLGEAEALLVDFSEQVLDVVGTWNDAVGDWRDTYDEITGTSFFADQDVAKAKAQVQPLIDAVGGSVADLFKTLGQQGVDLESFTDGLFVDGEMNYDVLAQKTTELNEQLRAAGINAQYTSEELLTMVPSLKLVGDSATQSAGNIREWERSTMSDLDYAQSLASGIGVSLVDSMIELSEVFDKLANDADGLTDADLELLNANRALIEQRKQEQEQMDSIINAMYSRAGAIGQDVLNNMAAAKYIAALSDAGVDTTNFSVERTVSDILNSTEADWLAWAEYVSTQSADVAAAFESLFTIVKNGVDDLYGYSANYIKYLQFADQTSATDVMLLFAQNALHKGLATTRQAMNDLYWEFINTGEGIDVFEQAILDASANLIQNYGESQNYVDFLKFSDSIADGSRFLDLALSKLGVTVPQTQTALENLYWSFLQTGEGIDAFEQAILDAGLAAVHGSEDVSTYDFFALQNEAQMAWTLLGLSGTANAEGLEKFKMMLEGATVSTEDYQDTMSQIDIIERFLASLENATDQVEAFSTDALSSAASSFASIADTARGFIDAQYANNTSYTGGLYRSTMSEALALQAMIGSGADYTQEELARYQELVGMASKYGANYLGTFEQGSFDQRFAQAVMANQFASIESSALAGEKTLSDVVGALERLKVQNDEITYLNRQLVAANQELVRLAKEV
ncbi:MAG: phage tail tape measure protein [Campylobacterales bacterium]|nr:phage tail tape measure protein [Campylobacterales bacterium]